jgi:hypothetical protein
MVYIGILVETTAGFDQRLHVYIPRRLDVIHRRHALGVIVDDDLGGQAGRVLPRGCLTYVSPP